MKKIYLDNNATTAIDPWILSHPKILEILTNPFNASSSHTKGQRAKKLLTEARETIANYFNVSLEEVIFTSGATESINLSILGYIKNHPNTHIISSSIEHASIDSTLKHLKKNGAKVTLIPPTSKGRVEIESIEKHLSNEPLLLVFGAANSETGVKIDLEALSHLAQLNSIPLIIDGVAILGKSSFALPKSISSISFSGHKIHAPQGVGICIKRKSFPISPLFFGGSQENNMRPGTQNLFAIVGMALAIENLKSIDQFVCEMTKKRDLFEGLLKSSLDNVLVNGEENRVSNTSNISFLGIDSETMLIHLDQKGILASYGSACSAGMLEPSRVLKEMELPVERVRSAIRFSISRFTKEEEIIHSAKLIISLRSELNSKKVNPLSISTT